MSFSADILKFAQKTGDSVDKAVKSIKIELFTGVIYDTRVGNPDGWQSPPQRGYVGGRLRGNWQTSTGTPILSTTERIDKTGDTAAEEVKRTVKGDTVDYMTNNLPYAAVYEEEDGMIAKNMQSVDRNIREAIRGVS